MSDKFFKVGETLVCGRHYHRNDRLSEINPGDRVKVLQEYVFIYEGVKTQDLTVQKGSDAPIGIMVEPGSFKRVTEDKT